MAHETKYFLLCIFVLVLEANGSSGDPCTTATFLSHLNERITGHKLEPTDTAICDVYLKENWYKLASGYVLSGSTNPCGTDINWYLQDALPTSGEKNLTVCRNEGIGYTCTDKKTVMVKKCGSEFVYYLYPVDGCDEAYCIENVDPKLLKGDAPDVSSIEPKIDVAVITLNEKPRNTTALEFYCNITPPLNTNHYYVVEWSLHTALTIGESLHVHDPYMHQSVQDFRKNTHLKEVHLKQHGIMHPGFTLEFRRIFLLTEDGNSFLSLFNNSLSCSVKAQKTLVGDFSRSVTSPPKYFGLQIVNKTESTIRIKDDGIATIYFKLTVPFGCLDPACNLDFNVYIPKKVQECRISKLAHNDRHYFPCGIRFSKDDYLQGTEKPLTIKAAFGKSQVKLPESVYEVELATQSVHHDHMFFQDYLAATIRVELSASTELLNDTECWSVSDPHMQTFDKARFDNQRYGTFIMYRHKTLEVEIQTKTAPCFFYDPGKLPYCNCAVAVRAGRDIFIIDHCEQKASAVDVPLCGDGVLSQNILHENDDYTVFLPTGGKVVLRDDKRFVNVHIYPSLSDINSTEGLCGIFDLDISNDLVMRKGSTAASSAESWMVNDTENLFDRNNYGRLNSFKEDRYLCQCDNQISGNSVTPQALCDTTNRVFCPEDRTGQTVKKFEHCDTYLPKRKRRSSGDNPSHQKVYDGYSSAETAYFRKSSSKNFRVDNVVEKRAILVKRSVKMYDNKTALQECLLMMNTTVFQTCSNIPGLDISGLIDNCVQDALLTNTMDWTLSHLESIKGKCINHVDVLQPISDEVLFKMAYDPFSNSTNSTNASDFTFTHLPLSTSGPSLSAITPELFSNLKAISCPKECNGHGVCNNGNCICNEPFVSFDCSINKTAPPEMKGIPDKGKCDLRVRSCAETAVFGDNFAKADTLECRLVPFKVLINGTIAVEDAVKAEGYYESYSEVYCRFPKQRLSRSPNIPSSDFLSRGYDVSVSNDGVGFSDSDSIIIFDSACVDCEKKVDKTICVANSSFCLHNGHCFAVGEKSGCFTCMDTSYNRVGWMAGPDCAEQVIPEEDKKLWIIGAVLGPFAIVIIATTAICFYVGKRNQSRVSKVGSLADIKNN